MSAKELSKSEQLKERNFTTSCLYCSKFHPRAPFFSQCHGLYMYTLFRAFYCLHVWKFRCLGELKSSQKCVCLSFFIVAPWKQLFGVMEKSLFPQLFPNRGSSVLISEFQSTLRENSFALMCFLSHWNGKIWTDKNRSSFGVNFLVNSLLIWWKPSYKTGKMSLIQNTILINYSVSSQYRKGMWNLEPDKSQAFNVTFTEKGLL